MVERLVKPELQALVDEAVQRISEFASEDLNLPERLKNTRQIYLFEIDALASEGVWDAAAVLQRRICQLAGGIIVAAEGVYDSNLELVVRFAENLCLEARCDPGQ